MKYAKFLSFSSIIVIALCMDVHAVDTPFSEKQEESSSSSTTTTSLIGKKRSTSDSSHTSDNEKSPKMKRAKEEHKNDPLHEVIVASFLGNEEKQTELVKSLEKAGRSLTLSDATLNLIEEHLNKVNSVAEWFMGKIHQTGYTKEDGTRIDPDLAKGIQRYTSAAYRGHLLSQIMLGEIYASIWEMPDGTKFLPCPERVVKWRTIIGPDLHTDGEKEEIQALFGEETYDQIYSNQQREELQVHLTNIVYDSQKTSYESQAIETSKQKGAKFAPDLSQSEVFFSLAAAQGDPTAQNYLGLMYKLGWKNKDGTKVPADIKKAQEFLNLAAAKDNPDAWFNLGDMYECGWEMPDGTEIPKNSRMTFNHYFRYCVLAGEACKDDGGYYFVKESVEEEFEISTFNPFNPPREHLPELFQNLEQKIMNLNHLVTEDIQWDVNIAGIDDNFKPLAQERDVKDLKEKEEDLQVTESIHSHFIRKGTSASTLIKSMYKSTRLRNTEFLNFYNEAMDCFTFLNSNAFKTIVLEPDVMVKFRAPSSNVEENPVLPLFVSSKDLDDKASTDQARLYAYEFDKSKIEYFLTLHNKNVRIVDDFIKSMETLKKMIFHYEQRANDLAKVASNLEAEGSKVFENPRYIARFTNKEEDKSHFETMASIFQEKQQKALNKHEQLKNIKTQIEDILEKSQPAKYNFLALEPDVELNSSRFLPPS